MADSAALLVDEVLPHQPMRQWVLSVPFPLRFLFASKPAVMGKVLGIVYRAIATHLSRKAGYTKTTAQTGAVSVGSGANIDIKAPIASAPVLRRRAHATRIAIAPMRSMKPPVIRSVVTMLLSIFMSA
jgi:hypothetical protein